MQNTPEESSPLESREAEGHDPPKRPRRQRVFGRFAFTIVALPFLVYFIGMQLGLYLDGLNSFVPVDTQHKIVRGLVQSTIEELKTTAAGTAALEGAKVADFAKIMEQEGPSIDALRDAGGRILRDDSKLLAQLRGEFEKLLQLMEAHEEGDREAVAKRSRQKEADGEDVGESWVTKWFPTHQTWYPTIYTCVITVTAVLVVIVFAGYFRIPVNFSFWSVIVGIAGIVVWVGLWWLDKHYLHVGEWVGAGTRKAFNPFEVLKDDPTWMRQFLWIRFAGLVVIVPIVEEFFLRGFLMRYVDDPDWDEVPIGENTWMGILAPTAYGVLGHPAEWLAAAVWFSMVTWLFLRTRSIWNCVIAHATTNLLLGLFVIYYGVWDLW